MAIRPMQKGEFYLSRYLKQKLSRTHIQIMAGYEFVTIWRFNAPKEKVWDEIFHSERWPEWWRGIESIIELEKGDENGIGSLRRHTWKSVLPYKLTFDMRNHSRRTIGFNPGDCYRGTQRHRTMAIFRNRGPYSCPLRLESKNYKKLNEPACSHRQTSIQMESRCGDALGRRGLGKKAGSEVG